MNEDEKKSVNRIDVDNLLMNLRPKGRYQLTQYFLLSSSFVACAASFIKMVFIAYVPQAPCSELSNSQLAGFGYDNESADSIVYKHCQIEIYNRDTSQNETIPCINGYNYSFNREKSFVSEWDLLCDNEALAELTQTLYALGCFVGAFVIPIFSDKYGRKPAHFICFLLLLINQMVLAAARSYWLFALLRTTEGALNYGMVMPAYSIMLEIFPGLKRTVFSALTGVLWGISMLLMTPLAYVSRTATWRITCIAFGAVSATLFFEYWFVDESLRWLLTNNKMKASKKIVKRAAKENGVNFDEVWQNCVESCISLVPTTEKNADDEMKMTTDRSEIDLGVMTLVKDPLARMISLVLVFNALMNSFTYYGIYMTSTQLAGNYYLNLFLTSFMEILGNVFMLFMLAKLKRKTTMLFFQIFSGISLLISVIINFSVETNASTVVAGKIFTLLGMFGISPSFCVLWLYAPEVYPTNLRNSGLGLMGMGSAFGNMISPFSRYTARHIAWLPSTIFGIGNVLGSLLLLTLPESKNTQMPTTMDDVRAFKKKKGKL